MCGIIGVLNRGGGPPAETALLTRMLALIQHRGPDECGLYQDSRLGMGSVRLSIIDLATGQQPLANEDETLWIVFNGEIFNYVELMAELKSRGHVFRTSSDTEVIVHLYEEYGPRCVERMNGQFVFAIWDTRQNQLFMARDRVGIRPLFYTRTPGAFVFGSEIKSLLAHPKVSPRLDPVALDQVFTFWTTLTPRTAFRDIYELPPGHTMLVDGDQTDIRRFWELKFPPADAVPPRDLDDALDEFSALLQDAVRLRLRADVPVVAYLSGGLDSSTTTEFILNYTHSDLRTFSITFTDAQFDESSYQQEASRYLGTQHVDIACDQTDIAREFAHVVWHTETPILRTAPVPMYLLSRLVRDHGIKVAVTGEGADETLAGYEIFKEALVRRFWARQPESKLRPLLLGSLYPYLPHMDRAAPGVLSGFFRYGLTETTDPIYSHLLRWHNTARTKQFFSADLRAQIGSYDAVADARGRLGPDFARLSPLSQAQYLESTIFMSGYLLSSQGDRPSMAHSVEGRYPFLDYRVIEFCANLPPGFKLRGLTEKYLLKRLMKGRLPDRIVERVKQPYRAPITGGLVGASLPAEVRDLLSAERVEAFGFFAPGAVSRLVGKADSGARLSETEGMALVGILSTQIVQQAFVEQFGQRAGASGPLPLVRHIVRAGVKAP
jgi:asparagine synthase (glutamine-hydrolysing)